MISRLKGTLLARASDRVEVETPGGVVYEVEVPLSVFRRLPTPGTEVEIRTFQVVREDSMALYGFLDARERGLFQRLLGASGVGAKLALAMLSTFDAPRLARALVEKDTTALRQVPGIGKKTAERIILDLADKVADLAIDDPDGTAAAPGGQAAVAALVALGHTFAEADRAVRAVLEAGEVESTEELIRRALQVR